MTATATITTQSSAETEALAAKLGGALVGGETIALDGALGAGKTCFVRGLAVGLGADPREVSSPTFVICHEYGAGGDLVVAHIDAYRLGGVDDLEEIGWSEIVGAANVVLAIEWSTRIEAALPDDRLAITFEHVDERTRRLVVTGPDHLVAAMSTNDRCPTCDGPVRSTADTFPFCSSRCRMADLHNWFGGKYRMTRPADSDDFADP